MEEFVEKLKDWIRKLEGIKEYSDEFNNWCFGTEKQKHIVHLHPYNTHVDMEVNDSRKFRKFLEKFPVRKHEWHPNNWLIVDLVDEESYGVAREIIGWVVKKSYHALDRI